MQNEGFFYSLLTTSLAIWSILKWFLDWIGRGLSIRDGPELLVKTIMWLVATPPWMPGAAALLLAGSFILSFWYDKQRRLSTIHDTEGGTAVIVPVAEEPAPEAQWVSATVRAQLGLLMAQGNGFCSAISDPSIPSPHAEANTWIVTSVQVVKQHLGNVVAERLRDGQGLATARPRNVDVRRGHLWHGVYVVVVRLQQLIDALDNKRTAIEFIGQYRLDEINRRRVLIQNLWKLWINKDNVSSEEASGLVGPPIHWVNQKLAEFQENWKVIGTGAMHQGTKFELPS